jgi:hypothetical protein
MVLSLTFCVLFATAVTLLFVPCLYLFGDGVGTRVRCLLGRDKQTQESRA